VRGGLKRELCELECIASRGTKRARHQCGESVGAVLCTAADSCTVSATVKTGCACVRHALNLGGVCA
jgi:hypothetical protein